MPYFEHSSSENPEKQYNALLAHLDHYAFGGCPEEDIPLEELQIQSAKDLLEAIHRITDKCSDIKRELTNSDITSLAESTPIGIETADKSDELHLGRVVIQQGSVTDLDYRDIQYTVILDHKNPFVMAYTEKWYVDGSSETGYYKAGTKEIEALISLMAEIFA